MDMRVVVLFSCLAVLAHAKHPVKRQTSLDRLHQQCRNVPPGHNPTEAFLIPHPDICNAFVTCNPEVGAWPQCTFCGNGTRTLLQDPLAICDFYTNPEEWVGLWSRNGQIPRECDNRRVVFHEQQVEESQRSPCFQNTNN